MTRIRYSECKIQKEYIRTIIESTGIKHIEGLPIAFVVSKGSKTRAFARIYGLPKSIQIGHNLPPIYTIEFVCEKIARLKDPRDFAVVFVHELLHIPYTRSGGLRSHGLLVNNRLAKKLSRKLDEHFWTQVFSKIKECCVRL